MRGKLYGVGAGPGDPELLTLKAVSTIQKCDVIAAPDTGGAEGTALSIIGGYLDGKELLECRFTMDRDIKGRKKDRAAAAVQIMESLESGKDVGFVTLGDPTTYSTYMYVHELVKAKGYDAEIVPGVTSFSAAAAALGVALCEGDEMLTIIPARHSDGIGANADEILGRPGTVVIMKSGTNLAHVLGKLKRRGLGDRTKIAHRATMEGQRLYENIEEFEQSPETGYFTLAIVKVPEE